MNAPTLAATPTVGPTAATSTSGRPVVLTIIATARLDVGDTPIPNATADNDGGSFDSRYVNKIENGDAPTGQIELGKLTDWLLASSNKIPEMPLLLGAHFGPLANVPEEAFPVMSLSRPPVGIPGGATYQQDRPTFNG